MNLKRHFATVFHFLGSVPLVTSEAFVVLLMDLFEFGLDVNIFFDFSGFGIVRGVIGGLVRVRRGR